MTDLTKRCPRCRGQKSVYRIGRSGYSLENFGGEKTDCPSCKGQGFIQIPDFVQEAKKELDDEKLVVVERKKRKKREIVNNGETQETTLLGANSEAQEGISSSLA
jgi:hypothetical protein